MPLAHSNVETSACFYVRLKLGFQAHQPIKNIAHDTSRIDEHIIPMYTHHMKNTHITLPAFVTRLVINMAGRESHNYSGLIHFSAFHDNLIIR
jgi:hypothetical protein